MTSSNDQLPAVHTGHLPIRAAQLQGQGEERDDDSLDLRQYWDIIWRHKLTIIIFTLIVVAATVIHTSMQVPVYRSTLTLQIERNINRALSESIMYAELYSNDFYQTQYGLLKSYSLAERVARDLDIRSPDRFKRQKNQNFIALLFGEENPIADNNRVADKQSNATFEPEFFAPTLIGALTVKPIKNSRLVHISFDSQSAQFAADAINSYARNFMEMNLERRVDDATYAQSFLTEQIKQARANLEDSEQRLVAYAQEKNIADLDDRLGGFMAQLDSLNGKLTSVQAARIAAQASYEQIKAQKSGDGLALVTDNEVIQDLKAQLGKLEAEYAEKRNIYKPAFPTMVQLKSQIDDVRSNIKRETNNIHESLKLKYQAADREEKLLRARISQLNQDILDLRKRTTDYQTIKRDVESNLVLYDSLLQQTKEVGVAAGVSANNISIVDPGRVPILPFKPDLRKNLTFALFIGLFGGIGLAFLFDKLDDTVKSSDHLEQLTGLPVLGVVPSVDKKAAGVDSIALLTKSDPKSPVAEAYRSFRTALSLSTVGGHPSVLHITSSGVAEGKTTTALSAATVLLQSGAKVLLVDADLRNPSIHHELSLPNDIGLSSYIAGDFKIGDVVRKSGVLDGLYVISAGPIPPNPAELLASEKMAEFLRKAEEQFDVVIIDGPPVLGLADSLVLSSMSTATVLVVDSNATKKGVLGDTMKRLRGVQANLIGTILTKYRSTHRSYHYMYSYYGYGVKDESRKRLAS